MPLVPQTAAATWRVLCALVCLLFSLGSFPNLFTSSGAFNISSFFSSSFSFFQVFATSPARGGHDSLFLLFLFCICLFRFVLFALAFLCFFSLLCFIGCVCRACRIQCDEMAWHCVAHCAHRIPGAWQRSISVA